MKKYIFILIFLSLVLLIARVNTEGSHQPKVIYLNNNNITNTDMELLIYKATCDTIANKKNRNGLLKIIFSGGHSGASYFLGYKYKEFDTRENDRLFLRKRDTIIQSYTIAELEKLPFIWIDTFKVHSLTTGFSKIVIEQTEKVVYK